ncbi:hypothetical protein Q3C01_33360 [Bradyrhizobium sp. UFLA05-109]
MNPDACADQSARRRACAAAPISMPTNLVFIAAISRDRWNQRSNEVGQSGFGTVSSLARSRNIS